MSGGCAISLPCTGRTQGSAAAGVAKQEDSAAAANNATMVATMRFRLSLIGTTPRNLFPLLAARLQRSGVRENDPLPADEIQHRRRHDVRTDRGDLNDRRHRARDRLRDARRSLAELRAPGGATDTASAICRD